VSSRSRAYEGAEVAATLSPVTALLGPNELAAIVSLHEFEAPGRARMAGSAWDYVAGLYYFEEEGVNDQRPTVEHRNGELFDVAPASPPWRRARTRDPAPGSR